MSNEQSRWYVSSPIEGDTTPTEVKAINDSLERQNDERNENEEPVRVEGTEACVVELSSKRWQIVVDRPKSKGAWYQVVGDRTDGAVYRDKARDYRASPLPALADQGTGHEDDAGVLLPKLYDTAVGGWRMLTDVRFKLLGLVPAVSVLAWTQLLREESLRFGVGRIAGVVVGLAGLAVTIGIWIYDERNNELYDELVSRARRIELEMGVDTGVFRGRPAPGRRFISHGSATKWVYRTVMAGWVLVIVLFLALSVELIEPDSLAPPAAPAATETEASTS